MVKKQAKELALESLNKIKENTNNLFYMDLEMQEYLKDKQISVKQAWNVFRFKIRRANFMTTLDDGAKPKYANYVMAWICRGTACSVKLF